MLFCSGTGPAREREGAVIHIASPDADSRREESGPEPTLTIRLFGGMTVRDSRGADFLPRSRKTRAVVAILALSAPRAVMRQQLTALLWSRREKDQARASLRQSVHELQEILGGAWSRVLTAERHHLTMTLAGVEVDVLAATAADAPRASLTTLFQEDFLEDLYGLDPSFDEWIRVERQRIRDLARAAGQSLLQESEGAENVVAAARALLRIDPAHDPAWRALIETHLDMGDRAAAMFAWEQWRERMGLTRDDALPLGMAAFPARLRSDPPRGDPPLGDPPRGDPPRDETLRGDPAPAPNGRGVPPGHGVAEDVVRPGGADHPPAPRRPGLRLGIREMRVIGSDTDDALAVGLAEELTTALSRFRWISCVSGGALAPGGAADPDNPRRFDPDLDMILDGTIQRGGDRVRIMVRLMDMRAGGEVIWANRFDRDAADALTLQDEVGAAIVAQIDPALLIREGERAALFKDHGISPAERVLRAVPAIYRLDRSAFHAAGELLECALRADPTLAVGHAWLAYWHLFLVGQGWCDDTEAATLRAAGLADTAVALDPNDARGLTLAGHVRGFLMRRPAEAAVLHERALALNPNLAIAWCFAGLSRSYGGDHEAALPCIRQAIVLSPSDPHLFFFETSMLVVQLMRGEDEAAAEAGRRAIELNPWFSSSFKTHLAALGHLGRDREAMDVRARLDRLEPGITVRGAVRRSPMSRPQDLARYAEGLRRAGLPEG